MQKIGQQKGSAFERTKSITNTTQCQEAHFYIANIILYQESNLDILDKKHIFSCLKGAQSTTVSQHILLRKCYPSFLSLQCCTEPHIPSFQESAGYSACKNAQKTSCYSDHNDILFWNQQLAVLRIPGIYHTVMGQPQPRPCAQGTEMTPLPRWRRECIGCSRCCPDYRIRHGGAAAFPPKDGHEAKMGKNWKASFCHKLLCFSLPLKCFSSNLFIGQAEAPLQSQAAMAATTDSDQAFLVCCFPSTSSQAHKTFM